MISFLRLNNNEKLKILDARKSTLCLSKAPIDFADLLLRFVFKREASYWCYKTKAGGWSKNRVQCTQHRRRSAEDLYLLCKRYFPSIGLGRCESILRKMCGYGKYKLASNDCGQVHRKVYYGYASTGLDAYHLSEFKIEWKNEDFIKPSFGGEIQEVPKRATGFKKR